MEIINQFVYRIQEDDTLNSLCLKFNTSIENIKRNNNEIPLFVGELVEIKINEYVTHIVKPAETIGDISKKYDVTMEEIKNNNNLETDKLYIGQIIKIYNKKTL